MSDRPLHILTVTSIYPRPNEPGLGAFVASQVESLRELGLHVDVCFLDVRRSKWELVKGIGRVRRAVKSDHCDLIHAHFGYNGVPACMQKKLPVVMSYCGTDLTHPKLRPISRWVARRADACIVKSESLQKQLGQPAIILPNGVDMRRFQPGNKTDARRQLGLSPDKTCVLFVATDLARPEKRYTLAQQAVAQADCELLVLNNRPHAEVPVFFQAADALILTSTYEGSPNVIKEAMACNLPIVSTDVGDVQKRLGGVHNCRICSDAPDALAQGLADVLRDGHPSDGRAKVAPLSSDAVAKRLLDIYRHVLAGRPPQ